MERAETSNDDIETLPAETASDWMSKLSGIIGEPTYKIDRGYDPEAPDEIAVYHIRREGVDETAELNDSNTIALTIMRDVANARVFRIDLRRDEGAEQHSFYSSDISQIAISRNEGRISFFETTSEEVRNKPIISLLITGKTVPLIESLKTQF